MPRASPLNDIEVFCRAAELGRFAAAAEALRLPPSSVSRAIARLEARLGTPLFTRTTRRITLTEPGAALFQAARVALQQIADAELAVGGAAARPVGLLRVAAPTTYGNLRVLPLLPEFHRRYPELRLEIHVTNRVIDLVEEDFDLVIRLGPQPPSALVSRTLDRGLIGTYAAPAYLAERPQPRSLDELADHVCVGFIYPGSPQPMPWEFLHEGRHLREPRANGPVIAYDPMGLVALAVAGGGLIQTGRYVVVEHLAAGRLVEVLTEFAGVRRPIVALFPANRRLSAETSRFSRLLWLTKLAAASTRIVTPPGTSGGQRVRIRSAPRLRRTRPEKHF